MLTKKMQDALNKQVQAELASAYLYLAMSASFADMALKGAAHWMRMQMQEEMIHAMKIYDYIIERDGHVTLMAVDAPPKEWKSALDTFQAAYAHEQKVTGMINALVDLAIKESDHATNNMLQWFVAEQVEEEASAKEVVDSLQMIGASKEALLMLDRELGTRLPPTPPAGGEAAA